MLQTTALKTRALGRGITAVKLIFWCYLAAITAAELVTSIVHPLAGMLLHLAVMVALLAHSSLTSDGKVRAAGMALLLAPMIRVLSLAMPLVTLPQETWYPLVSVPLLVSTGIISWQLGLKPRDLGLTLAGAPVQVMLAGGGLALGAIEYWILRPQPFVSASNWFGVVLLVLNLMVFTGLNEEVIFRGLIQTTSLKLFGGSGVIYVAVLFGALHIGYLSILDVVFVTAVGLLFGLLVQRGGSILGVTLMHGLTNATLFIIMPYLSKQPDQGWNLPVVGTFAIATALCLAAMALIWRKRAQVPASTEVAVLQAQVQEAPSVAGVQIDVPLGDVAVPVVLALPVETTPGETLPRVSKVTRPLHTIEVTDAQSSTSIASRPTPPKKPPAPSTHLRTVHNPHISRYRNRPEVVNRRRVNTASQQALRYGAALALAALAAHIGRKWQ